MFNITTKNGSINNEENFKNAMDYIRNSKYEEVKLFFFLKGEAIESYRFDEITKALDFFNDLLNENGFEFTFCLGFNFDILEHEGKEYYYVSFTDYHKDTTVILFR
jgi:hypothetical protein